MADRQRDRKIGVVILMCKPVFVGGTKTRDNSVQR